MTAETSVARALVAVERAIADAEVAAKAEERAEEMAWAATRVAATRQRPRAEATRVRAEAIVERAEARAATARETAEKAVAEWKNAVARETTDKDPVIDLVAAKDAEALALAVAEKAIAEAEAARSALETAYQAATAEHAREVVTRAERWHPGTEARIPRKEVWEAEKAWAAAGEEWRVARAKADKAVAKWKKAIQDAN